MRVIADTVIWSLALRRVNPDKMVQRELASLIEDHRLIMLGPIRQELLSGYSEENKFELLRAKLSHFENEPILDDDYVQAAQFHNICRRAGIQGSHTDFLICSCAHRLNASIYTTDKDFQHYLRALPISLHE